MIEGQEDCLYLNVYVPERSTTEPIDVLVWIHGGVCVLFTTMFGSLYLVCLSGIYHRNSWSFFIWT